MGHEFMERKNTSAAIEAYRKAIGIAIDHRVCKTILSFEFSQTFTHEDDKVSIELYNIVNDSLFLSRAYGHMGICMSWAVG